MRRPRHERTDYTPRLTDRHRLIFSLLDPQWHFKYLTSSWLHQFVGGNEHAFKVMLRNLYDAGYLDRPPQQRNSPNSNYKHLVYQRTDKAEKLVKTADFYKFSAETYKNPPIPHRSNSYAHELLVDLGFYAPLRLACLQDPALRLYTAQQLFNGASVVLATNSGHRRVFVPKTTRENPDPFLLPGGVRMDGTPFLLERMIAGAPVYIFVPGIEVDRATEPLQSERNRPTLGRHIEHILALHEQRTIYHHYGFPFFVVPIVTTSAERTNNAMEFLRGKVSSCRFILFKTIPDLAYVPHFPQPSPNLFLDAWQRVGFPPFSFDESGFTKG